MKTAKDLRDQYGERAEELEMIVEDARKAKRELTEQEASRVNEIESELGMLETQIEQRDRIEARLAQKANADSKTEIRHKREPETEENKIVKRYSFLKAINERSKGRALTGVEGEMHAEAEREASRSNLNLDGFGIPSMFFRDPSVKRDMTAGTSTAGGNTVATDIRELIDYLWPRTTVQQLGATVFSGLTSNVTFPRKSAVPTGTWEGETDANAESNPTTDTVSLTPKRVGTFVDISKQLLVQTSVPGLDQVIRRDIEQAIARALESAAINGSGSGSQPTGIMNISGVGVEAIGTNGGSPDWGNIVALEASIANQNADFGRLGYLTTPGMRGALKTIEKATNTGMFIWENGIISGVQGTIGEGQLNGYRAAISSLVPSNLEKGTGYNLHAILFANWEDLLMGQFGGMDIVVDPYTQATNTIMRIVVNSWWDIAVRHAQSFAVIKDASAGEFNT